MNATDHDFAISMIDQRSNLVFNVNGPTTAEPRPHCRDDAVRALQNTAVLNLHERSLVTLKLTDPGRHVNDTEPTEHIR